MTDLGMFLTTHPWMLHAIAVIALVAIFGVSCAIVSYVERMWSQGPRRTEKQREIGQALVRGLGRDMNCWN